MKQSSFFSSGQPQNLGDRDKPPRHEQGSKTCTQTYKTSARGWLAGKASTALTIQLAAWGLFYSLFTLASLALSGTPPSILRFSKRHFIFLAYRLWRGRFVVTTMLALALAFVSFFVSRISYIIYSIGKRRRAWCFRGCGVRLWIFRPGQRALFAFSLACWLHFTIINIARSSEGGLLSPSVRISNAVGSTHRYQYQASLQCDAILPLVGTMYDVVMFVEDVRTIPTNTRSEPP